MQWNIMQHKKEWSTYWYPAWMDLENIILSEKSQTQKAACCMIFISDDMSRIGEYIKIKL